MPRMQICLALVLVCALFSTAAAQENSSSTQRSTLTITVAAFGERVRITAPSSVVQMHVEVYASGGEKLFDQEIRGGNVFDWHLQDGQAQRLAPGDYVCVVTAKSINGKLTQKIGSVRVAENSASVQPGAPQLSVQQTQAIGPVEEDSLWTIAGQDELQTPTVLANDGSDGQMIRGRGALTFRIGNFFSGIDQEQMRLTETGNLGIGTSEPQSKLDVAGTIRAQRFLVVKPNLTSGDKTAATQATEGTDSVQPLVAGTGTQNQIAKWTDNAGTLGDSVITETGTGKVGVGIASPLSKLHVGSNFDALRMTSTNDTTPVWAQFNTSLGTGLGYFGVEGNTPNIFLSGTLPYATALASGAGGTALQLGSAGSVKMTILSGGNVGIGTANPTRKFVVTDGTGNMSMDFFGSTGRFGSFAGDLTLVSNGVDVTTINGLGDLYPVRESFSYIGTLSHRWNKVYAVDGMIQTSDARLKKAVTNLGYGLSQLLQLRPVSFQWKERNDGRTYFGLIAQEVEKIIPEAVERDKDPAVPLGMNYTSLVPVLIKAVQEQQTATTEEAATVAALQAESAALKEQNAALAARVAVIEQALQQLLGQQSDKAQPSKRH